jgi:hypothetical protein
LREFGREQLLRFCFADGDDPRAQISLIIDRVEAPWSGAERDPDPSLTLEGVSLPSFEELVDIEPRARGVVPRYPRPAPRRFRRRLHAATPGWATWSRRRCRSRPGSPGRPSRSRWSTSEAALGGPMFVVGVLLTPDGAKRGNLAAAALSWCWTS